VRFFRAGLGGLAGLLCAKAFEEFGVGGLANEWASEGFGEGESRDGHLRGPVENSEARKVMPRKVSRCFSMRLWRDFSSAIEEAGSSVTWSGESLKSLRSDMGGRSLANQGSGKP